jgi:predicted transcriptional regulator
MISKKSLRRKLQAYFDYLSDLNGSDSFQMDQSFSQLASYLCADRTSMMRELRNMCDEGLIERQGKSIKLLR